MFLDLTNTLPLICAQVGYVATDMYWHLITFQELNPGHRDRFYVNAQ